MNSDLARGDASPFKDDTVIYVINLPEATDRRDNVAKQLDALQVPYKFVEGVKGNLLSSEQIEACYSTKLNAQFYRRALSLGEIGCYLSHRKIWKYQVEQNKDWVLILEDDIQIENYLLEVLSLQPKSLPVDIVKLGDDRNLSPLAKSPLKSPFELVTYKKMPNCSFAYLLSLEGAKKLLKRQHFFRPVDVDFQFFSELDLTVAGITPYPVGVACFESSIDAQGRGSAKTITWPWRNINYRLQLFLQRKLKASADIRKIAPAYHDANS